MLWSAFRLYHSDEHLNCILVQCCDKLSCTSHSDENLDSILVQCCAQLSYTSHSNEHFDVSVQSFSFIQIGFLVVSLQTYIIIRFYPLQQLKIQFKPRINLDQNVNITANNEVGGC